MGEQVLATQGSYRNHFVSFDTQSAHMGSIRPKASNFILSLALYKLLRVGTKSFGQQRISASLRFHLDKSVTISLTKLPFSLFSRLVAWLLFAFLSSALNISFSFSKHAFLHKSIQTSYSDSELSARIQIQEVIQVFKIRNKIFTKFSKIKLKQT